MAAMQPLYTPGARGGASCATYYRLSIPAKVAQLKRLCAGICPALMCGRMHQALVPVCRPCL